MTRGRKKDLTIPPSRALAQQRDYRARKAQYVQQLEDRCKAAEDETARLKHELELARAGMPTLVSPQAAEVSSELLKRLSAASASLLQFQQLAFPDTIRTQPPTAPSVQLHPLRPASFPSPAPSPPALYPTPSRSDNSAYDRRHSQSQLFADESHFHDGDTRIGDPPFSRQTMSRSPSLGSDCCGGFMDCTDLVEEEHDELQEDDPAPSSTSLVQTSGMQSTSGEMVTSFTGRHKKSS